MRDEEVRQHLGERKSWNSKNDYCMTLRAHLRLLKGLTELEKASGVRLRE